MYFCVEIMIWWRMVDNIVTYLELVTLGEQPPTHLQNSLCDYCFQALNIPECSIWASIILIIEINDNVWDFTKCLTNEGDMIYLDWEL